MSQETILVVGATGNIGVSAIIGALKSGFNVLAIVRNQTSADKLFSYLGSKDGITTAEADIMSEDGVHKVIDKVKAGEVPGFQHVYSCAGGLYSPTPLTEMSTAEFKQNMALNFDSNFYAYRATVPYLLENKHPNSTWTICTGAQGDFGERAGPAMSQGALFSLATTAARDNVSTNIRFNEVYLAFRVEEDSSAAKTGAIKASDFAKVYEDVLARPEIKSSRVIVRNPEDIRKLRFESKVKALPNVYRTWTD